MAWRAGTRRRVWLGAGVALALAAGGYGLFRADLANTNRQLDAASLLAEGRQGLVEYSTGGSGPPVLVIHGAGGGHDQGRLLAEAMLGPGFRWIAPSRFGYLRSPLPPDASTRAQADAFADLLDSLGIGRVSILAMSGGAPPALRFAQAYPERTAAVVLLSAAPYAPLTDAGQAPPLPVAAYALLFSSDLPFWLAARMARGRLARLFDAAHPTQTEAEAAFAGAMVDAFLPVTRRRKGLANEGAAISPGAPDHRTGIAAPVLVIHARDDRLAPVATARFTGQGIPTAELLIFETGGHLLLGHHAEASGRLRAFLRDAPP